MSVATVLNVWHLGAASFAQDEGYTWGTVARSWPAFVTHLRYQEAGGILYSLFMYGWYRLGDTEAFLRAPSVVCAVATVPVVFFLGRRLLGRRAALVGALLVALSPILTQWGRYTRGYALAILVGAGACLALVRVVERPSGGRVAAWVALGVLLSYAEPLAFGVVLGQAVSCLFLRPSAGLRRRLYLGFGLIVAATLPLAVLLQGQRSTHGGFTDPRTPAAVARQVADLAGKGSLPLALLACGAMVVAAVVTIGVVRRHGRSEPTWAHTLVWCYAVVPIVTALALSVLTPNYAARYFVFGVPAVCLLIALGLSRARGAWFAGLVGLAVVFAVPGLHKQVFPPVADHWRQATRAMLADARPGDGVVFMGDEARVPFEYYLHRDGGAPPGLEPAFPSKAFGTFRTDDDHVVFPSVARLHAIAADPAYARLWVVATRTGWAKGVDQRAGLERVKVLGPGWEVADARHFGAMVVELVVRRPA